MKVPLALFLFAQFLFAQFLFAQFLAPLSAGPLLAEEPSPTEPLDEARLRQGLAASRLMTMALTDGSGHVLGHVADVVLERRDGHIAGLVTAGPQSLTIPWRAVTVGEGALSVEAPEGMGLTAYGSMSSDLPRSVPGQGWTLGNLIGDYAVLRGGVGYGTVRDVIFDPGDGGLIAVVVEPAARFGTARTAAYPYRASAWTPEAGVYSLPYEEGELAGRPWFDYDSLRGAD